MNIKTEDIDAMLRDLGFDDAEIARRKAFLEFTDEDVARLVEFHRMIEETGECAFFVEEFYRHLLAFPETARFITDPAMLARLKKMQTEYFHTLTAGDYGPAYARHRVRVGVAHERVGLAPKWYLGAYSKYLSLLIPKGWELLQHDPQKAIETFQALFKIVFFDMNLAIDTYILADRQAIQRKAAQLDALSRVAVAITSSLDPRNILQQIMSLGITLTGSKAACIAFYDQETKHFKEWVTQGLSEHFVQNIAFRPGGLADEAFTTTAGIYILSNDQPGTKHQLSKLARDEGIQSFICLPLTSHANHLGVIYFYRSDRDMFLSEEIEILTTFANLVAGAIDNARLHARAVEQSVTDALTGLNNRRLFDVRLAEELERSKRFGKPFSLMMLDIDQFKRINDSLGHEAGDIVLKTLAGILLKQVREVDFVARYGGEEFMFVLPEIDGSGAKLVAERIRRAVAGTPFRLPDGREIGVTVSLGIACYPRCAEDVGDMLRRADQALYAAKQGGRNRVVLYREMLKAELEHDSQRIVELLRDNLANITPIVAAVDAKAAFMQGHSDKVARYAVQLGQALGLPQDDVERLRQAGLLHDVGLLAVPDAILNKTETPTAQEWDVIRRHPAAGAEILEQVPALLPIAAAVRHHHERFDGSGYPDGLKDGAIPYFARILAVANAYSAMTVNWPMRLALPPEEVGKILRDGAGKQFDPDIVAAFVQALEASPPPLQA